MVTPLPTDPMAGIRGFVAPRRQALLGLASGLLSGTDLASGLSVGFDRAAEGRRYDDAYAESQKAEAERARQLEQTISYLRTQPGGSPWADRVEAGILDGKQAFQNWYEESQGTAGPEPTANMRDYQFAQENPGYMEFLQGGSSSEQPAAVREYEYAKQNGFTGSFMDFQTQMKQASRSGTMNATTQKELFEADEGIQAGVAVSQALDRALELNATAWDGPAADIGTQAGALFGDANSADTQELKNLVTAQALDQLKATFGAMPTEGERKILLEIQGSVTQSREVRKRIFERAKAAVERRVRFNQQKADALRSGDYFDAGYGSETPTAPATGDDIEDILSGYGL